MTGTNDAVRQLIDELQVERIDDDLFRGTSVDNGRGRSFGGLVAAQSLMAAIGTVGEEFTVHSLHSYFLLPGDPAYPIIYDVERIRDGRSFETRRVSARQHGRAIYYLTASFHRHEEGFDHHDRMPESIPPEEGVDLGELMRRRSDPEGRGLVDEWAAVEARAVGSSQWGLPHDPDHPSRQRLWLRAASRLPDDPKVHIGAFTWMSDVTLIHAALAAHTADASRIQMASLDHTIWFHRPFRADEWWLYDQISPSAQGGRGLVIGRVFDQTGRLVATTAQEGIIRPPRTHS